MQPPRNTRIACLSHPSTSQGCFSLKLCQISARLHWRPAASDELAGELLELGTGQALLDVLGAGGIGRDEGQGNLGLTKGEKALPKLKAVLLRVASRLGRLLHTGELNLGLLCSLGQALECLPVLEEVDALRR